ncbi:B-box zinc finger protein 22-like [Hibiscus syriacus]|uniref:B-box zinc finger protein 22-like n=1 Tax=Hibiscus syriacus TaxID=106335 RepID=UPI0019215D9F|nr:B-box zinc finger protein 22-like [Hibiscus syriacus]XP_039059299.1 B-box zinc finger protein 22-like [Hibiscus syriacus]
MRIQCNVCQVAEAKVLCCSDEAALCLECHEKVHAANKLASKHHRVPLSSSHMPKCDFCQEASGFFFCLQDRALLCRKSDITIHTANPYVSSHQRFVLTGVKVGLETSTDHVGSSSNVKSPCNEKTSGTKSNSTSKSWAPMAFTSEYNKVLPSTVGVENSVPEKMSYGGGSTAGIIQPWQVDDLLGLTDLNQSFRYMDNELSKVGLSSRFWFYI